MMLYELDNVEKAALMEVQMSSCDGCGESKPRAGFRSIFAYGIEGDFCHDCRHGKNCDCGADDE